MPPFSVKGKGKGAPPPPAPAPAKGKGKGKGKGQGAVDLGPRSAALGLPVLQAFPELHQPCRRRRMMRRHGSGASGPSGSGGSAVSRDSHRAASPERLWRQPPLMRVVPNAKDFTEKYRIRGGAKKAAAAVEDERSHLEAPQARNVEILLRALKKDGFHWRSIVESLWTGEECAPAALSALESLQSTSEKSKSGMDRLIPASGLKCKARKCNWDVTDLTARKACGKCGKCWNCGQPVDHAQEDHYGASRAFWRGEVDHYGASRRFHAKGNSPQCSKRACRLAHLQDWVIEALELRNGNESVLFVQALAQVDELKLRIGKHQAKADLALEQQVCEAADTQMRQLHAVVRSFARRTLKPIMFYLLEQVNVLGYQKGKQVDQLDVIAQWHDFKQFVAKQQGVSMNLLDDCIGTLLRHGQFAPAPTVKRGRLGGQKLAVPELDQWCAQLQKLKAATVTRLSYSRQRLGGRHGLLAQLRTPLGKDESSRWAAYAGLSDGFCARMEHCADAERPQVKRLRKLAKRTLTEHDQLCVEIEDTHSTLIRSQESEEARQHGAKDLSEVMLTMAKDIRESLQKEATQQHAKLDAAPGSSYPWQVYDAQANLIRAAVLAYLAKPGPRRRAQWRRLARRLHRGHTAAVRFARLGRKLLLEQRVAAAVALQSWQRGCTARRLAQELRHARAQHVAMEQARLRAEHAKRQLTVAVLAAWAVSRFKRRARATRLASVQAAFQRWVANAQARAQTRRETEETQFKRALLLRWQRLTHINRNNQRRRFRRRWWQRLNCIGR